MLIIPLNLFLILYFGEYLLKYFKEKTCLLCLFPGPSPTRETFITEFMSAVFRWSLGDAWRLHGNINRFGTR